MRTAPTTDLGRAIEVLNTRDTLRAEPEQLPDDEVFGRFLRWIGHPELRELVRAGDLGRFQAVRERLRLAFIASSEAEAVEALNVVLREYPAVTELVPAGAGGWRFQHRGTAHADAVAAIVPECAIALLAAIRDLGWDRLGTCQGAPCTCAYVDATKNHSRRYCSDQCNDRVAQAARRRRSRGGNGGPSGTRAVIAPR